MHNVIAAAPMEFLTKIHALAKKNYHLKKTQKKMMMKMKKSQMNLIPLNKDHNQRNVQVNKIIQNKVQDSQNQNLLHVQNKVT